MSFDTQILSLKATLESYQHQVERLKTECLSLFHEYESLIEDNKNSRGLLHEARTLLEEGTHWDTSDRERVKDWEEDRDHLLEKLKK